MNIPRFVLLLSLAICVSLFRVTCSKPNNSNSPPQHIIHSEYVPPSYQLSFNDEFESLNLDLDGDGSSPWAPWWVDWNVRFLQGNDDKAWKCDESYTGSGQTPLGAVLHEITENQTLRLYGRQTPHDKLGIVDQKPFIGGMISANNSYSQTYGYWEIKCKFDVSQGHHWAVWLLPADNSWPPEIDIVEVVGHQPDLAHCNAHGSPTKNTFTSRPVNSVADYHIYGFEWTPEEMIWTLDGEEHLRIPNYINKRMYVLISPEIGGQWTKMPDETTVWPTVCEIDYIRIYAMKYPIK